MVGMNEPTQGPVVPVTCHRCDEPGLGKLPGQSHPDPRALKHGIVGCFQQRQSWPPCYSKAELNVRHSDETGPSLPASPLCRRCRSLLWKRGLGPPEPTFGKGCGGETPNPGRAGPGSRGTAGPGCRVNARAGRDGGRDPDDLQVSPEASRSAPLPSSESRRAASGAVPTGAAWLLRPLRAPCHGPQASVWVLSPPDGSLRAAHGGADLRRRSLAVRSSPRSPRPRLCRLQSSRPPTQQLGLGPVSGKPCLL